MECRGEFAERLERIMADYGMTRRDVERGSGLSASTMHRLLVSRNEPRYYTLLMLRRCIGCSWEELMEGAPKGEPKLNHDGFGRLLGAYEDAVRLVEGMADGETMTTEDVVIARNVRDAIGEVLNALLDTSVLGDLHGDGGE